MSWNQYMKRIVDVCEVIAGQSPEGKYYNKVGEGLPFYQGKKEFRNREIGEPTTWTKKTTKEAFSGDILMSVRAPVGPINLCTQHICIGRGLAAIRATKNINNDYLFYYLLKHEAEIIGNTGAVFNSINKKQIENIPIPIPPLQEQQQIVTILDQAFEAIDQAKANIEKNIENAKELFQSKLNDIFSQKGQGWEENTLGELGTLTSSKRIYKNEYVAEGVPFYRSKEIKELAHEKDITLELFITKERYNEIKSQFGIPQEGDILLTAVGTIGEMYVVQKNEPEFYFKDGNIMWLKNFSTLNSYYLKYALMCFVEQLKAMSQGSAYSALTIEKLKKYSISFPSISEQVKIVQQLDELLNYQREIEKSYKEKINSIEDLKKSILQKAFAGELTNKTVEV